MALTLDTYRAMLVIDKNRLDDELAEHSQHQFDIGVRLAQLKTAAETAKNELRVKEASVYNELRASGQKLTVDDLKNAVREHRDCIRLANALIDMEGEREQWYELREAWVARGFNIGHFGNLWSSDYFARTTVTGGSSEGSQAALRAALRDASKNAEAPKPRRRGVL